MISHAGQSSQHIPLHGHDAVPVLHLHHLAALIITEYGLSVVAVRHLHRLIVQIICHRGAVAFLIRDSHQVAVPVIGVVPLLLHGIDHADHGTSLIIVIDGFAGFGFRVRSVLSDPAVHGVIFVVGNTPHRICNTCQITAGVVGIRRHIAAGVCHWLDLSVRRVGKVQAFSLRIRDRCHLSQRVAGIGRSAAQRIGFLYNPSCRIVGIGNRVPLRVFPADQITRGRVCERSHITACIGLCQHSSHAVIGECQTVFRRVGHFQQPTHSVILIGGLCPLLICHLCDFPGISILQRQAVTILIRHADHTVKRIISVLPCIAIGVGERYHIARRIIDTALPMSFLIYTLHHTVQAVVGVGSGTAQWIGLADQVIVCIIGKCPSAAVCIRNSRHPPQSIIFAAGSLP